MANDFDHTPWHPDAMFLKSLLRIKETRRLSLARMAVHHHWLLMNFKSLVTGRTDMSEAYPRYGYGDPEALKTRLIRVAEIKAPYWRRGHDRAHGMPCDSYRRRQLMSVLIDIAVKTDGSGFDRYLEPLVRAYLDNGHLDLDDLLSYVDEPSRGGPITPLETLLRNKAGFSMALLLLEYGASTIDIPRRTFISQANASILAGDFEAFLPACPASGGDPDALRRAQKARMLGSISRARGKHHQEDGCRAVGVDGAISPSLSASATEHPRRSRRLEL